MKLHPRLLREARLSGVLFVLTVVSSFLVGAIAVAQSFQLSRVVAGVFLDGQTLEDVSSLLQVILTLVLLRVLFTITGDISAGRMTIGVKTKLRTALLDKIELLGPEFLKNEKTADLAATVLQGVDALDAYFSQYLPQVLVSVLIPVTILVVVFPMDLLTAIVFLVTAPLIPLFMVLVGWAAEVLTKRQWKALTNLGGYFLDTLQGIGTLKVLGRSRDRENLLEDASAHYRKATLEVLRVTFISALALELIATLSTAVVAVEIGLRLLYGRIVFQQAFFILLIAPDFYLPLRNLSARYHAGMLGVSASQKIFEVLDTPVEHKPAIHTTTQLQYAFSSDYRISISNLSHIYPGTEAYALKGVNLVLERGRHYALAGRSGAGKSTLARILLRFIEPETGEITLNGMDISGFALEDWYSSVGWLSQHPAIFSDSLKANITLRSPHFTNKQIDKAVFEAGLADLLTQLPEGLNTQLLEGGTRFSGGQVQRVALARAFLRQPFLLILDEPSSHLDPELERSLDASIRALMRGRTTLTIAHRLNTLETADEVIFLQEGQVMVCGRHADLIRVSPVYCAFLNGGELTT